MATAENTFFFKQKTAYEIASCLVGSEMCIRDSDEALESLDSLIAEYTELEQSGQPNEPCDNAAALQLAF